MKFRKTTYRPSDDTQRVISERIRNLRRMAIWRMKYNCQHVSEVHHGR